MKQRPNKPKPGDKPLPPKLRFGQSGTLVFQPTAADKLKIAMGYAVRVNVYQTFQHNPGRIEVRAEWDVTEHTPTKQAPKIAAPEKPLHPKTQEKR